MLARRFAPSSIAIYPSKNASCTNTSFKSCRCQLNCIIVESIPPKILPIRSHFRRKLHLFDFSRRKARDKSGVASQSTSCLHQLVDTPRHKRAYASHSSFRRGGWAARPAAGHKIDAGRKKELTHCVSSFFLTGSYLSSQAASSQVLSTYKGLTTVFGMETGGSP